MKQRDISIDIMKFLAVLAITNSHMGLLYGKYSFLATGGAIGDVLFFFISGFTILLGETRTFDNYYKRRIARIYPSVFAWALISCIVFGRERNIVDILLHGGGWFVSCIMIYYVFLFFIRRYCINHLKTVLIVCIIVSALLYVMFVDGSGYNMYGQTYYKWCHYFMFMLQGAMLGVYANNKSVEVNNGWCELFKVLVCVTLFYGLCAFKYSEEFNHIQVFSLLPLLGFVYHIYRCCNSKRIKYLYNNTIIGYCMSVIGGLCLEVYLVQYSLFTDKLNIIFPFNIPIMFLIILIAAYLLRCLSRFWGQTFKERDYEWNKVFDLL